MCIGVSCMYFATEETSVMSGTVVIVLSWICCHHFWVLVQDSAADLKP